MGFCGVETVRWVGTAVARGRRTSRPDGQASEETESTFIAALAGC